jgi:chromosome segregation ATPase
MARAIEIIELNARVQGQLFKLLSLCASTGGVYGGASAIKQRLLPLLGQGFFASGISTDTSLSILEDVGRKQREVTDLQSAYDESLERLEADLNLKQTENENLQVQLEESKLEVDRLARQSTHEKMFNESEIRDLKTKLYSTQSENERLRSRLSTSPDPVDRVIARSPSPVPPLRTPVLLPLSSSSSAMGSTVVDGITSSLTLARSGSPLLLDDPTQRVRQQSLVSRFMDLYAINRLDAQDTLRKYTGDYENIQRIICNAVVVRIFDACLCSSAA